MNEVMRAPMNASNPVRFSVLRVPFFLEPVYDANEVGLYKSNAGPPPYLESNLVSTLETDM
jgi:hypothetical protein